MNQKNLFWTLTVATLWLAPSVCRANTITALAAVEGAHLLVGNFLIGVVEGGLVARWFKIKWWRAMLWLVAANYLSAWAGMILLAAAGSSWAEHTDITHVREWLTLALPLMLGAAFALTLLTEWPFFWLTLGRRERRGKQSLLATLTVNLATYTLVVVGYVTVSGTSLLTGVELVSAASLSAGRSEALYFIAADDGKIKRCDLGGAGIVTISELDTTKDFYLYAGDDADDDEWDLYLSCPPEHEKLVLKNFASAVPTRKIQLKDGGFKNFLPGGSWWEIGEVPRLSAAERPPWRGKIIPFPWEGIWCENQTTGEHFRLALETPLVAWPIRRATQVSDDLLVFQLGADQICLLNMSEKKLALIVRGRAPLPVVPR